MDVCPGQGSTSARLIPRHQRLLTMMMLDEIQVSNKEIALRTKP